MLHLNADDYDQIRVVLGAMQEQIDAMASTTRVNSGLVRQLLRTLITIVQMLLTRVEVLEQACAEVSLRCDQLERQQQKTQWLQ